MLLPAGSRIRSLPKEKCSDNLRGRELPKLVDHCIWHEAGSCAFSFEAPSVLSRSGFAGEDAIFTQPDQKKYLLCILGNNMSVRSVSSCSSLRNVHRSGPIYSNDLTQLRWMAVYLTFSHFH